MASVEVSKLSDLQKTTLSLSYAALLCHSGKVEFNAENVENILKAAGAKVDHHTLKQFVKAFEGRNISDLLTCGGGSASQGQAGAVSGGSSAPAQQKAAEPAKKEEEEEEVDLGMDMFGF